MKNKHILLVMACLVQIGMSAQTKLEGYVFEQNNRGFLNQVKITVFKLGQVPAITELESNIYGYFTMILDPGQYELRAEKDIFFEKRDTLTVAAGAEKVFARLELRRRPGYLFDATLAEVRESPDQVVDAIQGASIEIYNRTAHKPEMTIENDDDAFFQFTFERGNHYTILIRKDGYLAKRIEVYVNINGCILCIDGVRAVTPGVTENLTAGNEMGTLLANIELVKAKINKRIQIQNIYYDYDKWDIRADAVDRLDDVVQLMKDNPGLSVELGSHTDSRGEDTYNDMLSQKRAQAAVNYIISQDIDSSRITAKGYGERALVNRCANGVECTEAEHQENRRTELRITGIGWNKNGKTLEKIIIEEDMERAAKGKAPKVRTRDRDLPEANNSVKMPPPILQEAETPSDPAPKPPLREYGSIRILELPAGFKGYAVELAQSKMYELGADNPVFKGQKEVFHLVQADDSHAYFLVNLGATEQAKETFKKKIKPSNKQARLVLFSEKGKEYVE